MRDNFITKSKKISCQEAVAMIPDFLADRLSERDSAAFINHIQNCNNCYDELETNFMVEQTVRYLNNVDNNDASFNLTPMLKAEIAKRTDELLKKRFWNTIRGCIIFATSILAALLILDLTGIFQITAFFGF